MPSAVARRNTAGVRRDGLGRGAGRRTVYTGQLPRCSAGLAVGALRDEVSRNGIT